MILPIHTYGSPALRERTRPVDELSADVVQLIADMFETMHAANGIGLAAPQVGRSERLFVTNLRPLADDLLEEADEVPEHARGPLAFINPEMIETSEGETVPFEEGCLSIPDIRERVERPRRIRMRYVDRDFQPREIEASGMLARVLQHEYDHLEGVLFVDRLRPLRRRLLQRRLRAMASGDVEADYLLWAT